MILNTTISKQLLLYMAKCVTGIALVYLLSWLFHYEDFGWCIISVILVLSPDSKEAVPLAMTRIKANLLAGAAAMLLLLFGAANVFTISIAIVLTIFLCTVFNVMAGSKSALAAVIIIMIHTTELGKVHQLWYTTIERILSVIAGCVIGLVVTFMYHQKLHYPTTSNTKQQNEA